MSNQVLRPENFSSIAAECVAACKENTKGKAKQEVIKNVLYKRAGFNSVQSFDNHVKNTKKEVELSLESKLVEQIMIDFDRKNIGLSQIPPAMSEVLDTYYRKSPMLFSTPREVYSLLIEDNNTQYTRKELESLMFKSSSLSREEVSKLITKISFYSYCSEYSKKVFNYLFDDYSEDVYGGIADNGADECFYAMDKKTGYAVFLLDLSYCTYCLKNEEELRSQISDGDNYLVYIDTMEEEGCIECKAFIYKDNVKAFKNYKDAVNCARGMLKTVLESEKRYLINFNKKEDVHSLLVGEDGIWVEDGSLDSVAVFNKFFDYDKGDVLFGLGDNGSEDAFYARVKKKDLCIYMVDKSSPEIMNSLNVLYPETKGSDHLVYVDTLEKEGCLIGDIEVYKDKIFTASNFKDSLKQARNLLKELTK